MVMDAMLTRFGEHAPVSVMTRMTLQQAISATWVDEVFEAHRTTQYTRELLFSTVVELMSMVAVGVRPSLHAAAKKATGLPVSLAALYKKIDRAEPAVIRALVQGSAVRLAPILAGLRRDPKPLLPGYRIRIVDGNHLSSSEKRLAPLQGHRGAALPGQSLVVFDPDLELATDLVPCEDAYTSEQTLFDVLLAEAAAGELWIGDRHFCTRKAILASRTRGVAVLFREPRTHPNPTPLARRRRVGRVETGVVFEQRVSIPDASGAPVEVRRIEIELDAPTEDGDTVIRLLTTLPAGVEATTIAALYRRRWSIEAMFGRLESALRGEVRGLGYPKAALLAFGLAVIAQNVLTIVQAAIVRAHELDEHGIEVSAYHLAGDVRSDYAGMMIAIEPDGWARFETIPPAQLASQLLAVAAYVRLRSVSKSRRGPKPKKKPGYAPRDAVAKHVSTARVLRDGRITR